MLPTSMDTTRQGASMTLLLDRPRPLTTEIHDDVTRRQFIMGGVAAGLLVAAGCGFDDESETSTTPTRAPDGAFPVTIEHKYGNTIVRAEPKRVVTAGFNDADYALAFAVTPVGVRDFIGPFPEETRPWARAALAGAHPEKVSGPDGELNFEVIAALRPDLILAYSYLEEVEYKKLAQIAPTVVEPKDGSLWREHTAVVGRALGQEERAKQLVAEVEQRFARAIEENPEFKGKTAAIRFGEDVSSYYLLEPNDPRTGFFTSLGLELPERTGEISKEQVDLLDQDVIVVIGAEREAYQHDQLFQRLRAVREGRVVYLGGFQTTFAGALGFDSPLSLPAALDIAVPRLAAALDADPATEPAPVR